VEVRAETDAALRLLCDGLPIDFVRYPYPLLEPPTAAFGVQLAGLRDLAVMKLSAIARRGLRRDFGDLFEVLRAGLSFRECGEAYVARFGLGEADLYHVLRALTYFEDAEKDPVFPIGLAGSPRARSPRSDWTARGPPFRPSAEHVVDAVGALQWSRAAARVVLVQREYRPRFARAPRGHGDVHGLQ